MNFNKLSYTKEKSSSLDIVKLFWKQSTSKSMVWFCNLPELSKNIFIIGFLFLMNLLFVSLIFFKSQWIGRRTFTNFFSKATERKSWCSKFLAYHLKDKTFFPSPQTVSICHRCLFWLTCIINTDTLITFSHITNNRVISF